jgi:Thymidylate kinase
MIGQRGAFLVFEGCDRAGKTTQCKKLVDSLKRQNIKAKFLAFPGTIKIYFAFGYYLDASV